MSHPLSQQEQEQEQEQEGPGASSIIELHSLGENPLYDTFSEADSPLYDRINRQCSTLPEAEEYIDMATYSNMPPLSTAYYDTPRPQRQCPCQLHPEATMDSTGSTGKRRVKCHVDSSLIITGLCIAVMTMILIIVLSVCVYRPNMEALKAKLEEIDGESAKTRQTINELNATITQVIQQSSFVMSDNLTLAGQEEIETDLKNVDIYSSCMHEYLSSCSLPTNIFHCTTEYHDVIVDGYSTLDLSCHIEVSGHEGLSFYPVTSLRMTARSGETIQSGDSASVRFAKSEVRCECTLEPLRTGSLRNKEINCLLYRLRCPITSTVENVVIKP